MSVIVLRPVGIGLAFAHDLHQAARLHVWRVLDPAGQMLVVVGIQAGANRVAARDVCQIWRDDGQSRNASWN